MSINSQASEAGIAWWSDFVLYGLDSLQRTVLLMDIIRKRGNLYLDHLHKGQPPVLVFDYEVVLDGRSLKRPSNYALVRIIDRRQSGLTDNSSGGSQSAPTAARSLPAAEDRRHKSRIGQDAAEAMRRPIVIIDPRAGHGPGIGGSKKDSQIGMALDAGHPVYFLIFFTDPTPGQSLADVRHSHIRFLEEVRRRHSDAPRPAVIGNCQGGWLAALIGAKRPDLVGPMVFNGSPLSYWGGVEGINPMRYLGGLLGGVWINSLLADLGNGKFDGAYLVANFENLNPANTFWQKYYHVYANVDTEEARFLNFEKWWGGFFFMTDREIHTIVDGLFVGNRLERGEFTLEDGQYVDLKRNGNPVVVFASFADNITPPQQAFNWIVKTYGTVEEIKRRGQVIVYIGHSAIGHLGIFVSAKIARKEHKEIIASFDMLDYLPPGLYEMNINEDRDDPGEYLVSYAEKRMADIMAMDDGLEDEKAFYAVMAVSNFGDTLYRLFASPWIKLAVNEGSAELLRQLHPLRMQRYLFSDLNPWMIPVNMGGAMLNNTPLRCAVSSDNSLRQIEKQFSNLMVSGLDAFRQLRDSFAEQTFKALYENPWMQLFHPFTSAGAEKDDEHRLETLRRRDAHRWRKAMHNGGFSEAMIRIFLAVGLADQKIDREGYALIAKLIRDHRRLRDIGRFDLRRLVRNQSRILQTDTDAAIEALPELLHSDLDRLNAILLLEKGVAMAGTKLQPQEKAVADRIRAVLEVVSVKRP
jgi:pimeloyl-ACP methyl ester carboxylesterase